ncbi:ABC transporter permease [Bacillus aquiflavi]|uniref:ABC transporter permease n=1 Tax=Bacillus aquiflavi TaxID=2672567 RepID=A0A7W2ADG9_9BACI|nr:ABC transporter permease [Bacillus aquiflavi]MBA4535984.1 ABC transporter permease [Bacillus aquiflavi]UAC47725.1 ABC transporter permease [Bacillus aquiflavi]
MIGQIARSYMLENSRNSGMLIGNLLSTVIFIICSWVCKIFLGNSPETLDYMIKGQFLPISIMLLLFSFSFSSATIYLADLKANRTFNWLKRTGISSFTYYLGMGVGVFLLMNLLLIVLLTGYAMLIPISLQSFIAIILICNFVLLALYPLSFILAGLFKNGKVAQSMLVPILIIFMFSITMPSLFLTISNNNPQDYYLFLIWNPMLYLNDTLHFQLNLTESTWLPFYQYIFILILLSIVLFIGAKKIYNKR